MRYQPFPGLGRTQARAKRKRTVSAHDQRTSAADFGIQATRQNAGLGRLWNRRQVVKQRCVSGVGRRGLSIPIGQRRAGFYQRPGDFRILDRAHQQCA